MSVFFNYNNPLCSLGQSPTPFSFDPSINYLKELLLSELKQICYYILKLEDNHLETEKYRDKVIYFISLIIVNLEFKREDLKQFFKIIRELKDEIEEEYEDFCNKNGLSVQLITPSYKLDSNNSNNLSKKISEGERQSLLKSVILSKTKQNLYEIIINLVETSCLFLSELDNYGIDDKLGKIEVIKLLNQTNFTSVADEKWVSKIINYSKINYRIMRSFKDLILETYGPVEENEVSMDLKKGPSILISGHFFKDLEMLLKATEEEDINIYTHNDMLIAHSLSKLSHYKNLTGHYQRAVNDIKYDFATFPGPILITQNSQPKIDFVRGRIFTLDKYPAFGMSKIENYDFSKLIAEAKESEGFKKELKLPSIKVGYKWKEVVSKLYEIFEKIKSGEIKQLFLIDMLKQHPYENLYLEEFFKTITNEHYVISLSYPSKKENVYHIDSYYGYSLVYLILTELVENFDIEKLHLSIIFTHCDMQTISHILNLKHFGINSFFLGNCCPLTINPNIIRGLNEFFGVKYLTLEPSEDFKEILKRH